MTVSTETHPRNGVSNTRRLVAALSGVLLILAGALPATSSEIYRWTDAAGQPQFGSQPPPGVNAEPVHVPPPPVDETQAEALRKTFQKQQEAYSKQRQAAAEKKAKAAEAAKKQAERCRQARQRVQVLQLNRRIVSETGEYLDDDQRLARLAEVRKEIAKDCH